MDGENNGSKPYVQMDDLGGTPIILARSFTHGLFFRLVERKKLPRVPCLPTFGSKETWNHGYTLVI